MEIYMSMSYEYWKDVLSVIVKRTEGNIDHMLKNLQTIRQLVYVITHEVKQLL